MLGGDRNVPNPPALLAQDSMHELLRYLAARFDSVLIDAPSPLEVSDAVPLLGVATGSSSSSASGTRARRPRGVWRSCWTNRPCAPVLGVVANFVARGEVKRYGFSPLRGARGRSGAELAATMNLPRPRSAAGAGVGHPVVIERRLERRGDARAVRADPGRGSRSR